VTENAKTGEGKERMIMSTIEGRPVAEYVGVLTGEVVPDANVFRDLFAGLRGMVGDRPVRPHSLRGRDAR
jgi:hypothetical protein